MTAWTDWIASKTPYVHAPFDEASSATPPQNLGTGPDGAWETPGSITFGQASMVPGDAGVCVNMTAVGANAAFTGLSFAGIGVTYLLTLSGTGFDVGTGRMFEGQSTSRLSLAASSMSMSLNGVGSSAIAYDPANFGDGAPHLVGVVIRSGGTWEFWMDGVKRGTAAHTFAAFTLTQIRPHGISRVPIGKQQHLLVIPTALSDAEMIAGHAAWLASATDLTPNDAFHADTADSSAITQVHELAPADSFHAHTAESSAVTVIYHLVPDDAEQTHTAESTSITQTYEVAPDDSFHTHTSESPVVVETVALAPDNASHEHSSTSPTLVQVQTLDTDDVVQTHTSSGTTIQQIHMLVPNDALQHHTAESTSITVIHNIFPNDTLHTHTAESTRLVDHIVADPDRLVRIPAENRRTVVLVEHRIVAVPAEDRIITVPAA